MSQRDVISTDRAPAAIGPYSQAVVSGDLVFCSGQVALDATTGEMVGGDDVAAQAQRAMENLGAVLEAAGSGFDHVVKTTIYLLTMDDFQTVNAVYAKFFDAAPPARATVAVSQLPKNAKVEIDAIATRRGA